MCFRSWAAATARAQSRFPQIYEQISGEPAANYYSFAIIILTIANLFCILAGALLNRLGKKVPSMTGDGTNIMPVDSKLIKEDVEVKVSFNRL
ncbi:MAG: 2-hydroxycarboxylate transporter family protein [Clostridium sp.]